ncbi:MAG: prolyl oligopeptidase family serine peptidase [Victivallaceae bacterium]|jgi:predicted peptidase
MKNNLMLFIITAFVPFMLFAEARNAVKTSQDVVSGFHGFMWQDGARSLPYRLFIPAKLEAGHKYPLVVFFHGMGSIGNDNKKQLWLAMNFTKPEIQQSNPCFVLAPQCPETGRWVASFETDKMSAEPTPELAAAIRIIDQTIKDYPVDTKRVYVTGTSMGGYATWDIISRKPDFFAAAVPVCGGGDVSSAVRISSTPVWAFHGRLDPTVKVERSRAMIEAVKQAGGSPVYTEYPEVKHNAWDYSYKDKALYEWMFKQIKK